MLLEDPEARLFSTYLSYDASMFIGKAAINHLINERFKVSTSLPVKLILTTATRQGNSKVVKAFHKKLQKAGFEGLVIERIDLPLTHKQIGGPSFANSIPLIFPE